jgi:hypothetical protein
MRERAQRIPRHTGAELTDILETGQTRRHRALAEERREQVRERHRRGGCARRDDGTAANALATGCRKTNKQT